MRRISHIRSGLNILASGVSRTALLLLLMASTATAAVETEDTRPLVRLGSGEITLADLDASALSIPSENRAGFFIDPERIGTHLETLVLRRALVVQALEDPALAGVELSEVKNRLIEKKLVEEQFRRLSEALPTPDYEQYARELYDTNSEAFKLGEAVSVSHILIGTEQRTEAEALALANSVLLMARQGTHPFSELVAEYSDDPGKASNQGRYDQFTRGTMVKPFEQASFAMTEPGELTGPIKSPFGYHVIQFHERFSDSQQSYEQVRTTLLDQAQRELNQQRRDQLLAEFDDPELELLALAKHNQIDQVPLFDAQVRLEVDEVIARQYKAAYLAANMPDSVETLAREQYLTNRSQFYQQTAVVIQLLRIDGSKMGAEQAHARAQELATKVQDPEIKFEHLVAAHSDDHRKYRTGGKYRYEDGKKNSELATNSLKLVKVGSVVGPIARKDGYDFIKLLDRTEGSQLEFEQVKDRLTASIRAKLEKKLWDARLYELRQLPFWADQQLVASITERYLPKDQ